MANLKRNSIELVKEVKGDEIEKQRFLTPPFTPTRITKEALGILAKYEELEIEKGHLSANDLVTMMDDMSEFIANRLYDGQFTKEDLDEKYHGPNAFEDFKQQVQFTASGMQSQETKNFLKSKR